MRYCLVVEHSWETSGRTELHMHVSAHTHTHTHTHRCILRLRNTHGNTMHLLHRSKVVWIVIFLFFLLQSFTLPLLCFVSFVCSAYFGFLYFFCYYFFFGNVFSFFLNVFFKSFKLSVKLLSNFLCYDLSFVLVYCLSVEPSFIFHNILSRTTIFNNENKKKCLSTKSAY